METALIAARFVHIAATVMLFGAVLFPFYGYNSGDPVDWPQGARPQALLILSAVFALLGALCWFVFTAAAITGSMSRDALSLVARNTEFGMLWMFRVGLLTLVTLPLSFLRPSKKTAWLELTVAGVLLASLAGTGHAQAGQSDVMHWGFDGLHLLAAGAWLGGLLPLAFALANQDDVEDILLRFSTMGVVAVATLIVSGLINALYLVGSVKALFGTGYGWTLIVKLVLFATMLALAARNRFKLVPQLAGSDGTVHLKLIRTVVAEQSIGLCVLAAVAMLGTMEPAINAYARHAVVSLP
jgi:putative copper resistance protein D